MEALQDCRVLLVRYFQLILQPNLWIPLLVQLKETAQVSLPAPRPKVEAVRQLLPRPRLAAKSSSKEAQEQASAKPLKGREQCGKGVVQS